MHTCGLYRFSTELVQLCDSGLHTCYSLYMAAALPLCSLQEGLGLRGGFGGLPRGDGRALGVGLGIGFERLVGLVGLGIGFGRLVGLVGLGPVGVGLGLVGLDGLGPVGVGLGLVGLDGLGPVGVGLGIGFVGLSLHVELDLVDVGVGFGLPLGALQHATNCFLFTHFPLLFSH